MLEKLLSLFGIQEDGTKPSSYDIDFNRMVQQIRTKEKQEVPQGKQIYMKHFQGYDLTLDREFTGHYRISVFVGNHKVYGFSITKQQLSDEQFEEVWDSIISFLADNPSIQTMPENGLFEGHFFGNP